MADIAVFASGNGSNFQAIAERLQEGPHRVACLVCDRKGAFAFERARSLDIPSYYVPYPGRRREEVEAEMLGILQDHDIALVVLAGFMRLLTPVLVDAYAGRIVNIHPSLLPKYPGTSAIEESFSSEDEELGITIHYVDHGMDSGPIIARRSLPRVSGESLDQAEARIHALEHLTYPEVVMNILEEMQKTEQIVNGADRRTL